MAPLNRFFAEWTAMKLFLLGTIALCIGVLSFKDKHVVSPWYVVGCAALLYAGSWFFWYRSKEHHRRRRPHEHFSHRNPLAKLPPLREP
jgi:hypothetical protein